MTTSNEVIEERRILVDDEPVDVVVQAGSLRATDGRTFEPASVRHLPPVCATKVICVHLNYHARRRELGFEDVVAPTYFHKPTSCLNGHGCDVVRPTGCEYLNYEGEIAIVIGRETKDILIDEAADHIRGYTIANDFGLHDFRDTDANSMVRVKGSDTLGPVGPGVVRGWDFRGKTIRTRVNGETVQEASTDDMIWDMHYLVADLARYITLLPGDLIFSGTPAHSRPVEPGDEVTVEVEGLGVLRNRIVAGPAPRERHAGAQPSRSLNVRKVAVAATE